MPSTHQAFWTNTRFAVIGNSAAKPFPALTYRALRERPGATVYAVDPSQDRIEGDNAFGDLSQLPGPVDAAVLEVPREETAEWIGRLADAGITRVWVHMGRETPEALQLAAERGLELCTGTCAVQYLDGRFPHNVHRFFRKLSGKW